MEKPKKHSKEFYDYRECRDYLQQKYDYDERDLAGWRKKMDDSVPYQDFWHWVVEHHQISNGCFVTFSREALAELDAVDWQREIYVRYLDEFADESGELEMWIWW